MNDTENLPQELYNNAWNEMTDFLDDLRNKSPQEIIDSAYKITIHQDLLALLELEKFTPYEIEVFTELDHPLQVLYEQWVATMDHHMEDLFGAVRSYLQNRLQYEANKLYADPAIPRYEGLYREAEEKGEVHLYRASRNRDWACINAFTEHISEANEERRMREFVQDWTREFGHDRCKFLLGYTVQRADWDGRYSAAAKREAAKFDYRITDSDQRDPFLVFHTNAHPCLVNYAFELLMEQEHTKQKPAPRHDQPER